MPLDDPDFADVAATQAQANEQQRMNAKLTKINDKKSFIKYGTDRNPFENSYQEKNRVQETLHLKYTGHSKKVSTLVGGI